MTACTLASVLFCVGAPASNLWTTQWSLVLMLGLALGIMCDWYDIPIAMVLQLSFVFSVAVCVLMRQIDSLISYSSLNTATNVSLFILGSLHAVGWTVCYFRYKVFLVSFLVTV